MKLTLQHVNVPATERLDALIEEGLHALEPEVQIDEARVRLECRREESPGFRVAIHIVTPGPDLLVETSDHTLEAAIEKSVCRLEHKIKERAGNRLKRRLRRLQSPVSIRVGARRH